MELDKFLEHYGVKGMHWGVRNKRGPDGRVSTEHKRTEQIRQKRQTHGTKALTNKEIGDYNKRLELERKLNQLDPKKQGAIKKGHNFTKEVLAIGATANAVIAFSKSPAGKKLAENLAKKSTKKATKIPMKALTA